MSNVSLYFVIFAVISLDTVEGGVQLECDSLQCLDQEYQYQCNVTGSSILLWRIRNGSMMQLDDLSYTTVSTPSATLEVLVDAPEFSTRLSATSPNLISPIVFTAQSSINGYTIECDSGGVGSDTCTIVLADLPSAPEGITINTDTFTNSSVDISWTESSSPCVTGYRYNVSSTAPGWVNVIMESTSNSVTVEGLVPLDDQYTIVVTAIDTANRNSTESDPTCLIFNVPPPVVITDIGNTTGSIESQVNIVANWEIEEFNTSQCSTFPPLTGIRVSIVSDVGDVSDDSGLLSSTSTIHTFTNIPKGRNYTIAVTAINGVGNTTDTDTIRVPGTFVPIPISSSTIATGLTASSTTPRSPVARSPTITQSTTTTTTSSDSPTTTPPTSTTSTGGLGTGAIIGIAVAGVVIAILVIIVVILLIVYCCCLKSHDSVDLPRDDEPPMPMKHTKMPLSATHTQAVPETGQATYQDPSTIERKQAHTGDLYAQPDPSSKRRAPPQQPELATYQDPNTIQRTQAHTGDFYAQPEKKKPAQGGSQVYADLDMHSSVSPRSPQPLIQPESQQPVIYSGVHHQ